MILTYLNNLFSGSMKRSKIKARVTTEHSASSYGQPVVVLPDGAALDLFSWVSLDYRVVKASHKERQALHRLGLV